jgi:hypothetical protein
VLAVEDYQEKLAIRFDIIYINHVLVSCRVAEIFEQGMAYGHAGQEGLNFVEFKEVVDEYFPGILHCAHVMPCARNSLFLAGPKLILDIFCLGFARGGGEGGDSEDHRGPPQPTSAQEA